MNNLKSSIKERQNNNFDQPLINYRKSIKFSEDELKGKLK